MLGAICGDVIGSIYEFNNTKNYHFPLLTKESTYTDDSILTAAVAMWVYTDNTHSYDSLERTLRKIALSSDFENPMGGYGSGFLTWLNDPYGCALPKYVQHNIKDLPEPVYQWGRPYNSCGNGSAMRVSSVGWFYDTLEETEYVAGISARITHSHPEGIKGAQAIAAAIWLARTGKSKEEIKEYIVLKYGYDLSKDWKYWHKSYRWDGTCQGTVPQALICFFESKDYIDAVRKAVSLGGDSDTLACITGSVAEAYYGGVPDVLLNKILPKVNQRIKDIVRGFAYCAKQYDKILSVRAKELLK